jgi:hypothetical protein
MTALRIDHEDVWEILDQDEAKVVAIFYDKGYAKAFVAFVKANKTLGNVEASNVARVVYSMNDADTRYVWADVDGDRYRYNFPMRKWEIHRLISGPRPASHDEMNICGPYVRVSPANAKDVR